MNMKNITADKVRPAARRRAWGAGIAIGAISVLCSTSAPAQLVQPFTRGNLVVERLGTGGGSLSGNGNPIFFDEMTTNGTLVQSIAIPTNGTTALIDGNSKSLTFDTVGSTAYVYLTQYTYGAGRDRNIVRYPVRIDVH